jgi:hypothetical protein
VGIAFDVSEVLSIAARHLDDLGRDHEVRGLKFRAALQRGLNREVGLGLREAARTDRQTRIDPGSLADRGDEQTGQPSRDPEVRVAHRGHVDELALEQLDLVVGIENPCFEHAVEILDREPVTIELERRLFEQQLCHRQTSRSIARRVDPVRLECHRLAERSDCPSALYAGFCRLRRVYI